MPVRRFIGAAAALGAAYKASLKQKRLDHINERLHFFIERRGKRLHAYRPAMVKLDDGGEEAAVEIVQAVVVYALEAKGRERRLCRDLSGRLDFGIVAHAPQQPIGDARRAPRAAGDVLGRLGANAGFENPRRTQHDLGEFFDTVKIQMIEKPEAVAKRRGKAAGARG